MKIIIIVPLALLLLSSAPGLQAQSPERSEIVSVEKDPAWLPLLYSLQLDLLAERDGRIYILADAGELEKLAGIGIPFRIATPMLAAARPSELLGDGRNGDFHSYAEVERELLSLAAAYPNLARLETIGRSLEGRSITAIKISANAARDEAEAQVIFTGCHHAREWISVEVPLRMARHLLENYAVDAGVKDLVDHSAVWIVPLVNPDGLEYTINIYRYWRKNRRLNADGSFGIDINRNYGYQWGYDNQGSSSLPNSEVFRGTAPFSEPEPSALRDLFVRQHFQAAISFHSYGQVILYPWSYNGQPTPDDIELTEIAAEMAARIKAAGGGTYEYGMTAGNIQYHSNGEMCDWIYATCGIPAFTIELPPVEYFMGGFFNAEKEIAPIFSEALQAMTYLVQWAIASYSPPAGPAAPPAGERTPSPRRLPARK